MSNAQINYLNIGLMMLSAIIAFYLPFELFLFSYTVLGPLHYLTELSWLSKRNFFTPKKHDWVLLGVMSVIIFIPLVFRAAVALLTHHQVRDGVFRDSPVTSFYGRAFAASNLMMFVAFAVAAVLVLVRDVYQRIFAFLSILVLGWLLHTNTFMNIFFSIFIPTLVHVFVFTGAFILVGALRGRSFSGMLSLVVFVGCTVSLFVIRPDAANLESPGIISYYDAGFASMNKHVFSFFLHQSNADSHALYYSSAGILLARFIGFAYTYHYLNWFSKTSVIKWHQVPRLSLVLIVCLWVLCLALRFINNDTGLLVLYFLSLLHVIFEFPLNFQSFRDIGREIRSRVVGAS
jgi:hypothetical protein